jgi:spore maturation protein CgeB
VLGLLEDRYGARAARALYCAVDPGQHRPQPGERDWKLGYLGTYSADRQPTLERLLCQPARECPEAGFAVAGPLYPPDLCWPGNVERIEHIAPDRHAAFYGRQRFTLNVTRADMIRLGYSPSVRLFEAAACGVPIISDRWPGLATIFTPGREILVADSAEEVLSILREMPERERLALAERARQHVLTHHTAAHRAALLEAYVEEVAASASAPRLPRARDAAPPSIETVPPR